MLAASEEHLQVNIEVGVSVYLAFCFFMYTKHSTLQVEYRLSIGTNCVSGFEVFPDCNIVQSF